MVIYLEENPLSKKERELEIFNRVVIAFKQQLQIPDYNSVTVDWLNNNEKIHYMITFYSLKGDIYVISVNNLHANNNQ